MKPIVLPYWNEQLQIGMLDWRTVYLFTEQPVQLIPETYKGNLVYRIPASSRRFSYHAIKKQLIKKEVSLEQPLPF